MSEIQGIKKNPHGRDGHGIHGLINSVGIFSKTKAATNAAHEQLPQEIQEVANDWQNMRQQERRTLQLELDEWHIWTLGLIQ